MKQLLVYLSILAFSWGNELSNTTCNCGWRNSGRIVGGRVTKRNEYPWMASINLKGTQGCGGSIITEWHVLTATHCTIFWRAKDIVVSVGRHSDNQKEDPFGADHNVDKIIEYKGFSFENYQNDIAILVLAQPIRFNQNVGPVCLPNRRISLEGGQYIKATGWGLTQGTGDRSKLREVDVPVIPLILCAQAWLHLNQSGIQLCTFDFERQKGTCIGDSGGPVVYLDPETNRYTQVAIVSYGVEDCLSAPTVYTAVSAYVNWINDTVSKSKPSARVCTKA